MKSLPAKLLLLVGVLIFITLILSFFGFFYLNKNLYSDGILLYQKDLQDVFKNNVIKRLTNISFKAEAYILQKGDETEITIINDKFLTKLFEKKSDDTHIPIVLNSDGKILYHTDTSLIGKNYNFWKPINSELHNFFIRGLRKKYQNSQLNFINAQGKKEKRFVVMQRIEPSGWYILHIEDCENIQKYLFSINNTLSGLHSRCIIVYAIFLFLALCLFLLFAYLIAKKISREIEILSIKAENINPDEPNFVPIESEILEINKLNNALSSVTDAFRQTIDKKNILTEKINKTTTMLNNVINSPVRYGIIVTDENGNIELFNNGAEILFNISSEKIKGKNITIINKSEELEHKGFNFYIEKTEEEGYFDANMTGVRKDGTTFPMSLNASVRFNSFLEFEGIVVILYDTTEENLSKTLKIRNEQQGEHLKNIELIINTLPIGVIVANIKSYVIIENSSARKILSFKDNASSVGLNLFEVKAFSNPVIKKILSETISEKKQFSLSNVNYTPYGDNKKIYLDITFTPLLDLAGNTNGIIISFEDKTLLAESMMKIQELDTIIKKNPAIL